jgi:hypothetical protein
MVGMGRREMMAGGIGVATLAAGEVGAQGSASAPDLILYNGRIVTLDRARPRASALAVRDGEVVTIGEDREVLPLAGSATRIVDLRGRTAVPGLNDSHTHPIRGGLSYNMELR